MMTYENPATIYRAVPEKASRSEQRTQLVATWKTVDGKLICEWGIR